MMRARRTIPHIGQRIGRWTVTGHATGGKHSMLPCRCDCGTEKMVALASLARGDSRSCGCSQKRDTPEEFWAKADVRSPSECWEWQRAGGDGYGRVTWLGELRLAHRVAWELIHGPVPNGLCVLHRCDNPPCVNPSHLFPGTKSDNAVDCARKGRHVAQIAPETRRGSRNGRARLRELQVIGIMARWLQGVSQLQVAREFGVTRWQVGSIVRGDHWGHLFRLIEAHPWLKPPEPCHFCDADSRCPAHWEKGKP